MVKFSIRIASEEDYDSVLEMSQGIYNGNDYLPCIYHQWLKDTNHHIFLGISDGNIVGLLVAYINDGNKTLIHQALRIHRNYRGKGFSSKLIAEVNSWVRCNYPTVVKIRSTVAVAPPHEISHAIHRKEGECVIVEKDALFYYVEDKMPLLQKLKKIVSHQLFPCSKSNILQLVFSESASDLFEKNIHILNWVPYELIPSNIDEMFNHDDYLFTDFNPTEQMIGSKPHIMSFSQSRISASVGSPHWNVTICTKDPVLLRAHLLYQLITAAKVMQESFLFVVFLNTEIADHGKHLMNEELQLEPYKSYVDGLKLYEKELCM